MRYHIDTIPVWDAFRQDSECPLCDLYKKSEAEYIDSFLGASVISEDGVKYSRADYRTPAGDVSVFVQPGNSVPTKLTASLNGHVFSFIFMNEP